MCRRCGPKKKKKKNLAQIQPPGRKAHGVLERCARAPCAFLASHVYLAFTHWFVLGFFIQEYDLEIVLSLFFFCFLGPHLQHMKVPRLGVELELQLLATATASHSHSRFEPHLWPLHHSSWQHQILNPLIEARAQTCILMDTSRVCYCWATTGTPRKLHSFNGTVF